MNKLLWTECVASTFYCKINWAWLSPIEESNMYTCIGMAVNILCVSRSWTDVANCLNAIVFCLAYAHHWNPINYAQTGPWYHDWQNFQTFSLWFCKVPVQVGHQSVCSIGDRPKNDFSLLRKAGFGILIKPKITHCLENPFVLLNWICPSAVSFCLTCPHFFHLIPPWSV